MPRPVKCRKVCHFPNVLEFLPADDTEKKNTHCMKAHKYWSIGAIITMVGTFYTGYKGLKAAHKYFAFGSLICMIMAVYSGHKMISGNKRTRKQVENTKAEE